MKKNVDLLKQMIACTMLVAVLASSASIFSDVTPSHNTSHIKVSGSYHDYSFFKN